MLTQAQVLDAVRGGRGSRCVDRRDYCRLCDFFPTEAWTAFGFEPLSFNKQTLDWSRRAVLAQLAADVEEGLCKAKGGRGISAAQMVEVVRMWLWVLEDDEIPPPAEHQDHGTSYLYAVRGKYAGEWATPTPNVSGRPRP